MIRQFFWTIILLKIMLVVSTLGAVIPPNGDLDISADVFAEVPYKNSHIHVWRHMIEQQRFYASPIALLIKNSESRVLETDSNIVRFGVELWSESARLAVQHHIEDRHEITNPQIEMVPLEKVRVVSGPHNSRIPDDCHLEDDWKTVSSTNVIYVNYMCSRGSCDKLAERMKKFPYHFRGLELNYIIHGGNDNHRNVDGNAIDITGAHLKKSSAWRKLTMRGNHISHVSEIHMRKIAAEVVNEVIGMSVSNSDQLYPNFDDIDSIEQDIFEYLATKSEKTLDGWSEATYWEDRDLCTRPDVVAQELNDYFPNHEGGQSYVTERVANSLIQSSLVIIDIEIICDENKIEVTKHRSREVLSAPTQDILTILQNIYSPSQLVLFADNTFVTKSMKFYEIPDITDIGPDDQITVERTVRMKRYETSPFSNLHDCEVVGQSCYSYHGYNTSERLNWGEASDQCTSLNGHLLVVDDTPEWYALEDHINTFYAELIGPCKSWPWIGAFYQYDSDRFHWLDDSEVELDVMWYVTDEGTRWGDCVCTLPSYSEPISGQNCLGKRPYICEYSILEED